MVIQIGRYFIDKFFGQVFFKRRKKYFAILSLILLERDEDNNMVVVCIYSISIRMSAQLGIVLILIRSVLLGTRGSRSCTKVT